MGANETDRKEETKNVARADWRHEYGPDLAPNHADLLRASAISPEVAKQRQYLTIYDPAYLRKLGFSKAQSRPPGLLIPIFNTKGERAGYQYRPDNPRLKKARAHREDAHRMGHEMAWPT